MTDLGKVLILGSGGQLGTELRRSFGDCPGMEAYGRDRVDFTNEDSLREIVRQVRPNIILNAAAYTAVDRAESEPELAMAINGVAPRILAEEATKLDALLVHYSTDYVFDGSKSELWVETDEPAPLNVYGHTKLAGERAVMEYENNYLIFRTSWVFSPHGHNFLLTMRRLAKECDTLKIVNDQFGAPTSADALAKATREAVGKAYFGHLGETANWAGLYHMTCSGSTNWCEFARSIIEGERFGRVLNGRSPKIIGIPTTDYLTPARRPRNSVLSNTKLSEKMGIQLPSWADALRIVETEL
jgi:dTDP-4-dehydrorhamnose reductase